MAPSNRPERHSPKSGIRMMPVGRKVISSSASVLELLESVSSIASWEPCTIPRVAVVHAGHPVVGYDSDHAMTGADLPTSKSRRSQVNTSSG